MRIQWSLGRDANPSLQPKPTQYAATPLWRALRVRDAGGLQTAVSRQINQRLAVEKYKVTRAVESTPVVIPEKAAIEGVHVRRLDQD